MSETAYEIKVTLRGIRPPIWRRLRVPSTVTLSQLHRALQIAMGWTDTHLHQFRVGREIFGIPDDDPWAEPTADERKARLQQIARVTARFHYDYDFGDGWEHEILVERAQQATNTDLKITCLDGRRARPPEDCGGPHGYAALVRAHAMNIDPELRELVGPYWHPEDFDLDLVNAQLATLRLRRPRRSPPASSTA